MLGHMPEVLHARPQGAPQSESFVS